MKTQIHSLVLLFGAGLLLAALDSAAAAPLWFRPNAGGTDPVAGGVYTWNTSDSTWYDAQPGGTAQTWINNNTAVLRSTTGASYTIQLENNVTVAGFETSNGGSFTGGSGIIISATSAQTITFLPGATVTSGLGNGRLLTFGSNVALSGDFTIRGTASSYVQIAGAPYSGTVTLGDSGTGGFLRFANNTSTVNTKVVMANSASILQINGGTATISELSGSAGTVNRNSAGTLIIDQSTNTSFGGIFAGDLWHFRKAGSGTLVLSGTANHSNARITVDDGSLYIRGNMTAIAGTSNLVTVAGGGNFGGVTNLAGIRTVLSASNSALTPGMFNTVTSEQEIGTLTLGLGLGNVSLAASEGGTFNFAVGLDVGDNLLNSQIVLPDNGLITLGTDKIFTINLIDLDVADLANGNYAISLFHANTVPANFATFESQWQFNEASLPSNWEVGLDPFSISGNDILFSFEVVPEPTTGILLLGGLLSLAFVRRSRAD